MLRVGDEGLDGGFRVVLGRVLLTHEHDTQGIACGNGNGNGQVAILVGHTFLVKKHDLHGVLIVDLDLIRLAARQTGDSQHNEAGLIRLHGIEHALVVASLDNHLIFAVVQRNGGGGHALGHHQFHIDGLIFSTLIVKLQPCCVVGIGAAKLESDQAVGIRIIAGVAVDHINITVFHFQDHSVTALDVAVEALSGLHIQLQRLHAAGSDHRITLVTHGVLHGIQVFHFIHQLLLVVIGSKVVERALEDTLLHHLAGFHQADHTVAVDDHGAGISLHAHSLVPGEVCLHHGEGVSGLGLEGCHIFGILIQGGIHGDHFQLIAVKLISSLQIRELLLAGAAAHIPEVQHHGFLGLQDLRNGVAVAVNIGNGEIGDHIAPLIHPIRGIAFHHNGRCQHNVHLIIGQDIGRLGIVAQRYIMQFQGILITAGSRESDGAIAFQLTPIQDLIVLHGVAHIVLHALHGHAACGLDRDGIEHIRRIRRLGSGRNRGRIGLAGCQQAHAKHSAQQQQHRGNALFSCHKLSRSCYWVRRFGENYSR